MAVSLLLRPEVERQQFKQTIRITVDAPLHGIKTAKWLDYAQRETVRCANQSIRDIEKQGWRYVDTALQIRGPFSHIDPRGIPKKPNLPRRIPGRPSVPLHKLDRVDRDYYQEDVRPVAEHDRWDYEFDLTFTRRLLVEVPDIGPAEMTLADYLKRSA